LAQDELGFSCGSFENAVMNGATWSRRS